MASKQSEIDRIIEPGMHRIDQGLYLQVRSPTSRSWIFRYRFHGTDRQLGLGSAASVTFAQARNLRDDHRAAIRAGTDPVAQKQAQVAQAKVEQRARLSFRDHAEQYMQTHETFWTHPKHRAQWRTSLQNDVYPVIGDLSPAEITTRDIVELLQPIWASKPETARRIRGRVEAVLDYCADPCDMAFRNPAAKTGQLLRALPKVKRTVINFPALPYNALPAFFAELTSRTHIADHALAFSILTAARSNETAGARWSEIDLANRLWIVPAERMKRRREHRVPLSDAALAVLDRVGQKCRGQFIFRAARDCPLSHNTMLAVLRRMGRGDITTHGFRSTFRDWAGDCIAIDRETIEFSLAHGIDDATEASYRRSTALAKRRDLMQAWGEFCTGASADVITLESAAEKNSQHGFARPLVR
jgi:integrase